MANKVLMTFVVADIVFVITGALLLGFTLINQNLIKEAPTEGTEAVMRLLTAQFPLTGTTTIQEDVTYVAEVSKGTYRTS